jgi:hypothetical protein
MNVLTGTQVPEMCLAIRLRLRTQRLLQAASFCCVLLQAASGSAQPLKVDPTPQDYIERNGGGAEIVPSAQLVLDGYPVSCGRWATILDPNLTDYAASYPQFIILNMPYVGKQKTAVKLWIFSHECGHLFGGDDENKADCFAVRRGRAAGWLDAEGLDQVCSFISAARPDARHPGGADRCARMRQCTSPQQPAAKSIR